VTFAGLYLFTVCLFFRPYELFEALSWTTSAALIIAILTLVAYLPTQIKLEGTLTFRSREVDFALILLFLAVISIPMSLDSARSVKATIEFAKVVVIFVVLVNAVRTENRLRALVWLVLIASCVVSGFAVSDYVHGRMNLSGLRIQGVIGGIFSNPNDLALHLVMMVPIAAGLVLATRNRVARVLYSALVILFLFAIVATFSRGGFLGIIGVVTVFIWRATRRRRLLILGAGICLVIAFIALAPRDYLSRLSTTDDASAIARQDEFKRSSLLILRHPLLGVGIDNYPLYSNFEHATHNAYTQVGSELGVAAMTIYILLLFTALRRIRKTQKLLEGTKDNRRRWFAIGLEASLIGYMISSFFLSVAYLWYVYYLVGYVICFNRITEAKRNAASATSHYVHG
jgi:probable O-glycosylation ligase (exosortase A-associated)